MKLTQWKIRFDKTRYITKPNVVRPVSTTILYNKKTKYIIFSILVTLQITPNYSKKIIRTHSCNINKFEYNLIFRFYIFENRIHKYVNDGVFCFYDIYLLFIYFIYL